MCLNMLRHILFMPVHLIHLLWNIQQKLVNASQVRRKTRDPTPAEYLSEREDKPSIPVQKQTRFNHMCIVTQLLVANFNRGKYFH